MKTIKVSPDRIMLNGKEISKEWATHLIVDHNYDIAFLDQRYTKVEWLEKLKTMINRYKGFTK